MPIAFFSDLKPGEVVLARWNDNKFYSATVDYIGTSDAKKPVRCTKDIKKKDIAAQRFYSLPSNQAAQSFSTHQSQDVECSVQPPPTQSTPSTNPPSTHPQSSPANELDNQQWNLTNTTAKDSFLKMLYSPIRPAHAQSTSDHENSDHETATQSPSAGASVTAHDPDGAWRPCEGCKAEVEKLMEEKQKLENVLCSIVEYTLACLLNLFRISLSLRT